MCSRDARFGFHERACTLLSNSQSTIRPIEHMISHGFAMFQSRAYVHQYLKHGLEIEDFSSSFARLEQTVHSYRVI